MFVVIVLVITHKKFYFYTLFNDYKVYKSS